MEVTGSATQTIASIRQPVIRLNKMLCGTVKATDTENADTEISTGSTVWSSHIVEQSNDQGLETVFVSLRSSRLRQKTSCMALVDKVKHFNFCCIICEFLFFC